MAQSYGIGITVWSPLAGGLLTGKYRADNWPADSRFAEGSSSAWESGISLLRPLHWSM